MAPPPAPPSLPVLPSPPAPATPLELLVFPVLPEPPPPVVGAVPVVSALQPAVDAKASTDVVTIAAGATRFFRARRRQAATAIPNIASKGSPVLPPDVPPATLQPQPVSAGGGVVDPPEPPIPASPIPPSPPAPPAPDELLDELLDELPPSHLPAMQRPPAQVLPSGSSLLMHWPELSHVSAFVHSFAVASLQSVPAALSFVKHVPEPSQVSGSLHAVAIASPQAAAAALWLG